MVLNQTRAAAVTGGLRLFELRIGTYSPIKKRKEGFAMSESEQKSSLTRGGAVNAKGQSLGGGSLTPIAKHATVVYEEKTGRIRHIHHTVILPGGKVPTESEMEKVAKEFVLKRGQTEPLKVLHVDPGSLQHRVKYAVHPQKLTLVEAVR